MVQKRTQLIFLIGAAVVVLGGVLVYVNRPSAVAQRALANLGKAETATFSGRLNLANSTSTQKLLGEEGTIDIGLKGAWKREEGPDALATDITLTTQTDSLSVKIEGEARLLADKIFWQITTTPQAFPVLVRLKDQWIVIGREPAPEGENALANRQPLLSKVDRKGTTNINGTTTVHYTAIASEQTMVALMDSLAGVLGTSLSEAQIEQVKNSVAQVQTVPLELWVKRWSNEPKQLRVSLIVPDGNTMQFTLTFDSLNQPVTIEAPEGAKTLQEIAQQNQ